MDSVRKRKESGVGNGLRNILGILSSRRLLRLLSLCIKKTSWVSGLPFGLVRGADRMDVHTRRGLRGFVTSVEG